MPNPNVEAKRAEETAREAMETHASDGFLPLVLSSVHPAIINRWNMTSRTVPTKCLPPDPGRSSVRDVIWVEAWVVALLEVNDAKDLVKNGWSTMEQNKPRVLELKILYDELRDDAAKRITLLVEYRLTLDHGVHQRGADAALQIARHGRG